MPKYTIIEYRTDHGPISAVTLTSKPDRIVFGFTDRTACTEFLRRKRARNYLLNGETIQLEPLPQHTDRYKRCKDWLEEFSRRIAEHLPVRNPVLRIEKKKEIDHCTITDTQTLELTVIDKNPVFILHNDSTWGTHETLHTDRKPEELIRVTEFLQEHSEEILQNLHILD